MWGIAIFCVLVVLFYRWSVATHAQWRDKGVKVIKPYPLLGSWPKMILMQDRRSQMQFWKNIYDLMKDEGYGIIYVMREPSLVVTDVELIKDIMVKSFDHFVDRTSISEVLNKVHTDTSSMLVNMTGDAWKSMRSSLSPAFTARRLRTAMDGVASCGPQFCNYLRDKVGSEGGEVEMKDEFYKYTTSMIASGVFGVDANAYDPSGDSDFVHHVKKTAFKLTPKTLLYFLLYMTIPSVGIALNLRITPKNDFLRRTVTDVIERRRKEGVRGNDVIQVFIDMLDKGGADANAKEDEGKDEFEAAARLDSPSAAMSLEGAIQSAILFLSAGYDTTACALSLITLHLAVHPEVQAKAREEADELKETLKAAGKTELSYEDLHKLNYADAVIDESLRLTPVASAIERLCVKDYRLPNGVTLPKGTKAQIPVSGLHVDPAYWEDPDKFNPDRFSKENRGNINPYSYLAFGQGPRNCIGMRFAKMEVKTALYYLLTNFVLEPTNRTVYPPLIDQEMILTTVKGGNWLRVKPRH